MGSDPALTRSVCELGLVPAEFLGRVPAGTEVPLGPTATCVLGVAAVTGLPRSPRCSSTAAGSTSSATCGSCWLFGNNVEDSMGRFRYARLLPPVRAGRGRDPDPAEPVQRRAHGWRLGRDQRRDGGVRRALPARAGAHAGRAVRVHHPHRGAGLRDARATGSCSSCLAEPPRHRARVAWPSGPTSAGSSPGRSSSRSSRIPSWCASTARWRATSDPGSPAAPHGAGLAPRSMF